jgi:hypothetical protein
MAMNHHISGNWVFSKSVPWIKLHCYPQAVQSRYGGRPRRIDLAPRPWPYG